MTSWALWIPVIVMAISGVLGWLFGAETAAQRARRLAEEEETRQKREKDQEAAAIRALRRGYR
jgi:hypothetical protein